jgi:putative membrane protein
MDFLIENYLFVKSIHIIGIIAWMAAMLYLPRLFIYHTQVKVGSDTDKLLIIMERRLLRVIMNPAMIITLIAGLILIYINGFKNLGIWFHIKMLLLVGLFAIHGMSAKYRKDFEKGRNKKSTLFYRVFNESTTVLMILIVFLAVMKPF